MNVNSNYPIWTALQWKSLHIKLLEPLREIAYNLWWSWNEEATDLFESIDSELWKKCDENPALFLSLMSPLTVAFNIQLNKKILELIDTVYGHFKEYMSKPLDKNYPSVAYFCMEYGLTHVLKIYSGGLGILAGDYLKQASDSCIDMCGIGFLYKNGYFTQVIDRSGNQIANYEPQDFSTLPIEAVLDETGNLMILEVPMSVFLNNYNIFAKVWQVNVGRIKLYLLDTDTDMNSKYDRPITEALYGGDWENRLKQEILLGIGGVLLLKKLGIKKDIYHCNEGHAALCNLQRLADFVSEEGMTFERALDIVRSSSLYTVHTPVPAGHDYFDKGLFGKYLSVYADRLGLTFDLLIGLGKMNPDDQLEKFCMSTFACKTCADVNGVSELHGEVSREMFADVWPGFLECESHVGYVTNGVHFLTWASHEWKELFSQVFDEGYLDDISNDMYWKKIYDVDNAAIRKIHQTRKDKLIDLIEEKLNKVSSSQLPLEKIKKIVNNLRKDMNTTLLIGFGRRFATYKRAYLLFTDLERLKNIIEKNNIIFIYAGKSHPNDGMGKDLIKRIYEISMMDEFLGKVIFLENYDIDIAKTFISGVDVWLNNPTRPMEASGTSGEKALMNGVLNFSVLDGWWKEGYREGAGWALTDKKTYDNQDLQDKLDAETIYDILENEIIPLYYKGVNVYDCSHTVIPSDEWIDYVKDSIYKIAPHYTMKRQLDDYIERFYVPLALYHRHILDNSEDYISWKEEIRKEWDNIEVRQAQMVLSAANLYNVTVDVKMPESLLLNVIVETLVCTNGVNGKIVFAYPPQLLSVSEIREDNAKYTGQIFLQKPGIYNVAARIRPKDTPLTYHKQLVGIVKYFQVELI